MTSHYRNLFVGSDDYVANIQIMSRDYDKTPVKSTLLSRDKNILSRDTNFMSRRSDIMLQHLYI